MRIKAPKTFSPWNMARPISKNNPRQTKLYGELGFKGMDARTEPDRLLPGYAQSITNGFPDGAGGIVGRGGFIGQFTSPHSTALWTPTSVQIAGDTTRIVYAAESKLWYTEVGSATQTEIKLPGAASFTFPNNGEDVRMVRYGAFLYGIEGGATGRMFRVDVTSGGTWTAAYVDFLPPVEDAGLTLSLHPTIACLLDGVYEYRVRTINSAGATYPPTGGTASVGEALYLGSIVAVQPGPTETAFRTQKVTDVGVGFDDPASAADVTHYQIERRGGTLGIVDWRIVAIVQKGVDSGLGTFANRATESGWVWDAHVAGITNVFLDFMADSALEIPDPGNSYYSGTTVELGEYPPVGAVDISFHGGRVWLAKANTVYASWLIEAFPDATDWGLIFTTVPDPDAPNYLTEGASFTIAGDDDPDTILALSGAQAEATAGDYGSIFFAMRQNSHIFISGDNASNWRAEPSRMGENYGCLSPRALCNVEGRWIYQSPQGAQILATNGPPKFLGEVAGNFPLEPLLSQDAIAEPTGYRRISYVYYDRQLWVFAPNAGEATPFPTYVWNAVANGWNSLTPAGNAAPFTGAVVLNTQVDAGQLYLAGLFGQLYYYDPTATGDKFVPGGFSFGITMSALTAKHGQRQSEGGFGAFSQARATALRLDIIRGAAASTLTWTITAESAATPATSYTLAAGRNTVELTNIEDVRGVTHEIEFSISAIDATTRLAGYSLEVVEQGITRG